MERLWAPWRMEYIEHLGKEDRDECIFCVKCGQECDDENYILKRGQKAFILLNTFPYTNGHLLIAPYRHTGDLAELDGQELQEIMCMTSAAVRVLKEAMHPDGFNIGMNLGRAAGAGIAAHLHMHVVPRWSGDTNFMTVCGEAKVIPEALSVTLQKLRQAFDVLERKNVG